MARKGQFKKGGGRHGSSKKHHRAAPKAIVVTKTRTRTVTKKAPRRHRRHSSGGGMKLTHLALASAGLAFVTSAKSPVGAVKTFADKIPGAKTFGPEAVIGIGCLLADRFVKPNKWLKLLGTAGVVLAAVKVGSQGTDFKFVGDDGSGDVGDYDLADDIEGDDDIGDDDDVGDVGDDDE